MHFIQVLFIRMNASEFDLKLEEIGFHYNNSTRGKSLKINNSNYNIIMPLSNDKLNIGIAVIKIGSSNAIESSFSLKPNSCGDGMSKFYRDCVKCFELIDLIFDKARENNLLKMRFKYDHSDFYHFQTVKHGETKVILSFNEDDFLFDHSLGFAFYTSI